MNILIIYSTLTGNTQDVASALYNRLSKTHKHHAFKIRNVRDISLPELKSVDAIILGSSSWDEAGSPDTKLFLERLATTKPNLSKLTFALFGLGDSQYKDFCASLPLLQKSLSDCRATIYANIKTIDGFPTPEKIDNVLDWAQAFLKTFPQT